MAFDYSPIQKKVSAMLDKYGKAALLRRVRREQDPTTGGTIDVIVAEQKVMVVQTTFEHRYIDGLIIQENDVRFYLSAYRLDPLLAEMSDFSEMRLVDEAIGRTWGFVNVKVLVPGGITLLFDIHAQ